MNGVGHYPRLNPTGITAIGGGATVNYNPVINLKIEVNIGKDADSRSIIDYLMQRLATLLPMNQVQTEVIDSESTTEMSSLRAYNQ